MPPEEACPYYCTTDATREGPQHENSVTASTSRITYWQIRAGSLGNYPLTYGTYTGTSQDHHYLGRQGSGFGYH